jgi:hypothetical protein
MEGTLREGVIRMAVPETHWLAAHDITTPANYRPHGPVRTTANMRPTRYHAVDGVPVVAERRHNMSRVVNAVVFLIAVWLTVSADPVAYRGTGRFDVFWNHAVVGLASGAVALVRVAKPAGTGALALTNSLLGAWLIISPFGYGYGGGTADGAALWNDLAVGGAVLALTLATAALRDPAPYDDEVPPPGTAGGWHLQ